MKKLLEKIFYNPALPAGFGSIDKLYRKAKTINPNIRIKDVKSFLKGSRVYTLHKLQRKKFPRRKVVSAGPRIILSCDLAEMGALQEENHGVRYLLVCIDVFSRYMFIEPLQRKSALDMVKAFTKIFKNPDAQGYSRIFSDRGKEFYNKKMEIFLREKKMFVYSVYSQEIKASIAEAGIKRIKHKIFRFLTANNTLHYLGIIDKLVSAYNETPHRGLKGKTPSEIHSLSHPKDWRKQFRLMYKKQAKQKKLSSSKLTVGSLVRVVTSNRSDRFATGYTVKNTEEIFRISKIYYSLSGIVTYELEDWGGEKIKGIFYRDELIETSKPKTYNIEILKKRRKRDGTLQYYVHWKSYPVRFDEWVNASEIKNISDLPPS